MIPWTVGEGEEGGLLMVSTAATTNIDSHARTLEQELKCYGRVLVYQLTTCTGSHERVARFLGT
jgi:hypothetical protein